jgi:putative phosphoribosyl transferase
VWLENRRDAGQKLASLLKKYRADQPIVLGIPRGGVIVAAEVAKALQAPLDILIVRKIGAPHNEEVAIGAVMPDGMAVLDTNLIAKLAIPDEYINRAIEEQTVEIKRRRHMYKGDKVMPPLENHTVILVDDGIATGYTIEAAVEGLRNQKPKAIILAAPVAPVEVVHRLRKITDEVVCLDTPEPFYAVGQFYQDFSQTSDNEVIEVLQDMAVSQA